MTITEALELADAYLYDSSKWRQYGYSGPDGSHCLSGVLLNALEHDAAWTWLYNWSKTIHGVGTARWNDQPGRTFAEVKAFLREAIAEARREGV